MKVRLESTVSFYLLIGIVLTVISLGDAFSCPEHCSCIEVQKRYTFNHAKCTSLDGLRILGKTSELHSLDLSSLNLTKINNQLDKLTNLSKLDLSDNRLSEINVLSTKRIRVLNLSGNRITSGKLAKIPSTVKNLNLTHNDITILTDGFKRFVHLRSLELADNPLNCTCETLEIRNWLQERQVWTVKPILCMAPIQFKGWPWLAARQSEVCDPNGLTGERPRMLPSSMDTTADNDLMVGDDPNAGGGIDMAENDEGFLPVNRPRAKRTDTESSDTDIGSFLNDDGYEGSGSSLDENIAKSDSDDGDGNEGSGFDITELPMPKMINLDDDDQISNETQSDEDDRSASDDDITTFNAPISLNSSESNDSKENASIEAAVTATTESVTPTEPPSTPAPVPVPPVDGAVAAAAAAAAENDDISTLTPIVEETIVPVKNMANDAEYIQTNDANEKANSHSEETKMDDSNSVHEGSSTYVLLAILGILLVALILYVAAKRSKANTKNRRNNNDIESPAQEMLTMDKNNLGKPIQNPVEFIPLIPDKHDPEKKTPNKCNGEEPLLQKLTEVENEHEPNHANGNGIGAKKANDATQQQHAPSNTHQLNGNAKPVQNGVNAASAPTQPDENDQRQYQPISPKPSRYSPVSFFHRF